MSIKRIIIIDDSVDDAEALTRALRDHGGVGEIRWFEDVPNFQELSVDQESLIVLDLILGNEVDGLKALEQIAGSGKTETPIFIVSGQMGQLLTVAESYGRAKGLKIVGSGEKPLSAWDLLEASA